ncbi:unnamed protein product [Rotaria sordida]|uniref:PLAT domain-containing protein n=1 Tax=Rotaria sordida TaxID=392033 RepID=A0A819RTD2_9BILA|nr:unnamed protein product [Rotaria sordida]
MDVKYIGGDVPWTLPFGDHFYSSSQASFTDTQKSNLTSASDLEIIARRHSFEPLYSTNEKQLQIKSPFSNANIQWMNTGVLFTDKTIEPNITGIHKTDFYDDHEHTFCYLCSINQHHHERTKPRDQSQRRKLIPYNNPKALKTRSSSLDRTVQSSSTSDLVPYRFIVRTGIRKNSGTRAQVFLYMYGTEKNWTSINLQARTNTNSDGFPSGSIRTFCLKGPDIGQLHHLNVNLVGARSDKEWFLKEIEITNLNTSVTWLCEFNCWLPKKQEDDVIKPTVKKRRELSLDNLSVYILQIRTGGKAFAGTDANIQVIIRGSTSQTRQLALTSSGANLFEQNQLDTFAIVGGDIGDLLEITVESDKSQLASDWDLKEMIMWKIIPIKDDKQLQVYFPFNTWLGDAQSKLKAKREIYPSTDHHQKGPTCYHITVKTGKDMGAGTDANVYIIIYGKSGRTTIHHLDNRLKNDFERNTTSEFTIMDIDVGKIDRIKIWHDNTGVGSAWLLDSIIIRKKHSTCRLITNIYIQRLEKISQILYQQACEQLKKDHNLRLSSNERRSSKLKDLDDLTSNRSILRSPILYDKNNLQKKVTWDEQSIGSQDEPFTIDTQQMKKKFDQKSKKDNLLSQIETGHFEHQATWISSHNYHDNKWQINSIEERNTFDLDQTTRSLFLSDRSLIKTSINEKDDDIYEFVTNSWLTTDKGKKPEIYLTPKSSQLSTTETKSKSSSSSTTKKSSSDYRHDKYNDEDLKHSSKLNLEPLEKSPRSQTSLRDISKTQFDDSYSSQRSDQKISNILKRQEESFIDKYHRSLSPTQHSISPHSNKNLKISSTNEQELLSKGSYHSRTGATALIDTRSLSNQQSKSPRFDKEPLSPVISNRDLSARMSKPVTHSNVEISSRKMTRNQVYSSAYGTIPMDDF